MKPDEAAQMLSVSGDYFDEHAKPGSGSSTAGRGRFSVPVAEVVRWFERNAARVT